MSPNRVLIVAVILGAHLVGAGVASSVLAGADVGLWPLLLAWCSAVVGGLMNWPFRRGANR